jgi:hypothetical protein
MELLLFRELQPFLDQMGRVLSQVSFDPLSL